MAVSNIKAVFPADVQSVWKVVTDVRNRGMNLTNGD